MNSVKIKCQTESTMCVFLGRKGNAGKDDKYRRMLNVETYLFYWAHSLEFSQAALK